jgi:molybdenum cofactor biosynthesis enzyme MoaA
MISRPTAAAGNCDFAGWREALASRLPSTRYFRVTANGGRLGLIPPISHGFYDTCNRVRLACDGALYARLGRNEPAD